MNTITIQESEYLDLKQQISILEQKLSVFQDEQFIKKLQWVYQMFNISQQNKKEAINKISIKRGAGKHLITYIADDFDAPLEDFKEYM